MSNEPAPEAIQPFEAMRQELEQIVGTLERGEVAVDEAIRLWQRGEELHRRCALLLEAAEGRLEMLGEQAAGTEPPTGDDTG